MKALLPAGHNGRVPVPPEERILIDASRCVIYVTLLALFTVCGASMAHEQVCIDRIEKMPNLPQPLVMRDWKQVARDYDALVFDHNAKGRFLPLIWIDRSHITCNEDTFGIYTVPEGPHQGPAHPNGHEGINCIAAVLSASLVGIDKRGQDGLDYVRMCEPYFSPREKGGIDLFSNGISIKPGTDSMWYALLPTMLAFCLDDQYPGHGRLDEYVRRSADTVGELGAALADGKWYTGYDFYRHQPVSNGKWTEGDAVAGVAWIQYMAFARFKDAKHLQSARLAMDTLSHFDQSTFYEVLMPYGVLAAARMNAEQGTSYDLTRMLNWCFNGDSACRRGWGMIVGRWGDYDVSGLTGSLTDGGGYAFAMNTYQTASTLAPLPRYDTRYARAMGKLLLNAASASRYFYANGLPAGNQTCYEQRDFTRDVIAYEGFRRVGLRPQDAGRIPCACGDPLGGRWGTYKYSTDFSLYGSSHVGMMAAVLERTEVEGILQIDCLKTDYFHPKAYSTYLYFNPHPAEKQILVDVGPAKVDLYETTQHRFIASGVTGKTPLRIPPDSALVIVLVPSGKILSRQAGKLLIDGVVVDYHSSGEGRLLH